MKTMLKLTVLSFVVAVSLHAEQNTQQHTTQTPGQPANQTTQPAPKDRTAELMDKVNACLAERGGKAVDASAINRSLGR